jgi:hypothetical protein
MIGKKTERWRELCEQAANEYDPQTLHELVVKINRLLEERTTAASAEYFRDWLCRLGELPISVVEEQTFHEMTQKKARRPNFIVDDKFCALNVVSHGRLICKKCGHVVFPDDKDFGCPWARCLEVALSSPGFADYGDGSRETEEQIRSYAGAHPSHCKTWARSDAGHLRSLQQTIPISYPPTHTSRVGN